MNDHDLHSLFLGQMTLTPISDMQSLRLGEETEEDIEEEDPFSAKLMTFDVS